MFLARTVSGSASPEVRHPTGPGQPRDFSYVLKGEEKTITVSGRQDCFHGIPTQVSVLMSDGSKEEHVIGAPPAALLACDDVLVTTLRGAAWPGSAGHRHAQDKLHSAISIAVAEGRYFDAAELATQRRAELFASKPDARVALLMERGMSEKAARAHLRGADGTEEEVTVEDIEALMARHLGGGEIAPPVDPASLSPSPDEEQAPQEPKAKPKARKPLIKPKAPKASPARTAGG